MTVSVVTGASTGIGFATALHLARQGHRVHASVRSLASGAALAAAADGLDLSLMVMDVDDDASVADAFAPIVRDTGVDVLVNNAGIAAGHAIEDTPLSDFQRSMNTNAWGMLRCIQAVLPSMRTRGSGHIVNVTSVAGQLASAGHGAYAMSKWAAEALTEVLAAEVMPFGIRVAAIEPGVILTPIFEKGVPEDPTTPYVGGRRLGEFFMNSLTNSPASPEIVAAAIWHAITTDEPKLRYLVGADAERLGAYRRSITNEEWITRQADPDDAAWRAWMANASGVAMPPPA